MRQNEVSIDDDERVEVGWNLPAGEHRGGFGGLLGGELEHVRPVALVNAADGPGAQQTVAIEEDHGVGRLHAGL